MINLYPASNTTSSLRYLPDQFEKHLRSLEVYKQNANQDVFVSNDKGQIIRGRSASTWDA